MLHEQKKIALIADELMTVFMANGAKDIDVSIKCREEESIIHIYYRNCPFDADQVDDIRHHLKMQRQAEVEGYYWQLIGDNEAYDELYIVGAMLDEAIVEMEGGDLHVKLTRAIKPPVD